MQDEKFFVGQKAFIEINGQLIIIRDPNGLDFPGGKVQPGEDLTESLKREVREEIGIEIEVGKPFCIWQKSLPMNHQFAEASRILIGYKCTYTSGEVRVTEKDLNIDLVSKDSYQKLDDDSNYFEAIKEYFTVS